MANSEMDEDNIKILKDLRIKRGSVKSALTRAQTALNNFDPRAQSITLIEVRQEALPRISHNFDEVQSQIELLHDNLEDNERERAEFEERYYALKSEMLEIINSERSHNSSINLSNNINGNMSMQRAHLPPVSLPKFDGHIQEWESFYSYYKAIVHEDERYPAAQKFSYLRSALSGPALDVVKGIPITESNYGVALEKLKQRYDNQSLVIQSHIRAILDITPIHTCSAIELQHLQSKITAHVASLKELGQPVEHWDAWLVTIILRKLDSASNHEWQLRRVDTLLPTYSQIEEFLRNRCIAFENSELGNSSIRSTADKKVTGNYNGAKNNYNGNFTKRTLVATNRSEYKCICCSGPHKLYTCNDFKKLSSGNRITLVRNSRLCFNCLSPGHRVNDCLSNFNCGKCKQRHNTLLHYEGYRNINTDNKEDEQASNSKNSQGIIDDNGDVEEEQSTPRNVLWASQKTNHVFLATAIVLIYDKNGIKKQCRAVLDSGSQINFISKKLANMIGLPHEPINQPISGIGANCVNSRARVTLHIESRLKQYNTKLVCHVLPTLVENLPPCPNTTENWEIPTEYLTQLADPSFRSSGPVDLLIGGGIFFELLEVNRIRLGYNSLCLQDTKLGWVLVGEIDSKCLFNINSVGRSLEEGWMALEQAKEENYGRHSKINSKCLEEQQTVQHFLETAKRDDQGRFVLKLPFKPEVSNIGDTLKMATTRFLSVERRLQRDDSLKKAYVMFMEEYEKAGHMIEITDDNQPKRPVYLPHHPVFKASSSSTKLRVVFDASAKSSTGVSLNDILMHGPTVQEDLFTILLRFRKHQYVLTADIEKMFRQIAVATEDQDFQRIVWRTSPSETLRSYKLTTVTYGTTPASYMATQCLSILAEEHSLTYPRASRAISQDFYMDDLMTGAETIEECMSLQHQITSILNSALMPIRKWCSNSERILANLEVNDNEPLYIVRTETDDIIKSLGLCWNPKRDQLGFQVVPIPTRTQVTKRILLSDLNKIFDPLGFLTPVLIKGKIFLQQLWQLKVGWDKPLVNEMKNRWELFYQQLQELGSLPIPRKCIPVCTIDIEFHGFCDASLEAYGACVYVRSKDHNGKWYSHIACSKSRVAPLRGATIPRLELCGALVLTQLAEKVAKAWDVKITSFHFWTDSTVVLGWLNCQTSRLKTYVANRVEQILEVTNADQWKHVVTDQNPADLLSRGISPIELKDSILWWSGPRWLIEEERPEMQDHIVVKEQLLPEIREVKLVLSTIDLSRRFINAYPNWNSLLRAIGWLSRFMRYLKKKKSSDEPRHLTVSELRKATLAILKMVQVESFNEDLALLRTERPLPRKSKLRNLCPFLKDGLIHVGGRLENANIPYQQKHPIVLPANNVVTKLIFEHYHRELSHCGPQSLLAQIRRQYWPLRGRIMARTITTHCVQCIRAKPKFLQQLMAPLPKDRVQCSRPFTVTGVDFAGPLIIRSGVRRVSGTKAWIAVFVCFSTRAIHLEVVEDLSSSAFVASLRRFVSRRGKCARIYSDNATNFVGAQRELSTYLTRIDAQMAQEGIEWFFNPPAAPHFGGLWESAVKSTKFHLNRIMKETKLTIGELNTLLCQIEACVNSRPMTPISNDPSDLEVLTPAHFLIGGSIFLPSELDLTNAPSNGLRRWKYIQYLMQTFWKRWENEYLPQCQVRGRWLSKTRPLKINDVVIIKGESTHPTRWKLGRVIKLHPGRDDIIRVVTLKTANGTELCRPIVKLCRLPIQEDEDDVETTEFQPGENVDA